MYMLNIIREIKIKNANIAPEYDNKTKLLNLIDENVWKEVIDICGSPNYDIGELLEYPKFAETVRHAIEADSDVENIYDYIDEESLKKWVENDEGFMRQLNKAYSDYIEYKVTQARFDQKILKMWDEEHMYDYGVHIWDDQPANWDYWMERWVATVGVDIYDIYDDMDGSMNQYMVDAVSKTSLDEIKIRSANNFQLNFPKDENWYIKINANNYEQILDTLRNEGFEFADGFNYVKNAVGNHIERYSMILFYNLKTIDFNYISYEPILNINNYTEINNPLNEIKIRNANVPFSFPKNKNWYVEVNINNVDTIFNALDNGDFNWFIDKQHNYRRVLQYIDNGKVALLFYDKDTNEIAWGYHGMKDDFINDGYEEIKHFLNEIKIRSINKPSIYPKDEKWYTIVGKTDYKQVLNALENEGFLFVNGLYSQVENYANNGDWLILAYNLKAVDWHFDGVEWYFDENHYLEINNPLNEIKIRNINKPQLHLFKDKNWFIKINKDNYKQILNEIKIQGFDVEEITSSIYAMKNQIDLYQDIIYAYTHSVGNVDWHIYTPEADWESDYEEIQNVLNEIKIRNVNKPTMHFPKNRNWYIIVNKDNYEQILDTLENDGFKIVYGVKEDIHFRLINQLTRKNVLIVYETTLKFVDVLYSTFEQSLIDLGYEKIENNLNEIKIRNINAPQIYFPKDKRWFIKVNSSNLDQTSKMIDSQGFKFQDVVNGFSDHYTDDYDYINHLLDQGQEIIYVYYNDGYAVDFHIYNKFEHNNDDLERGIMEIPNTLNEIKIRNANIPSQYPKDKDWYVEVNKDNYTKVINDLKEQGFRFALGYNHIYGTLEIAFSEHAILDEDKMYIAFNTTTNNIDYYWGFESDKLENTDGIQVINEIKIRNVNIDPYSDPKQQRKMVYYALVDKDDYLEGLTDFEGYGQLFSVLKFDYDYFLDNDEHNYTDEESLKVLSRAFENLRSYVEKNGGHMNTLYNKINS